MSFNGFKFSLPLQMRWNDMDALGHVNNAVFVTYFETARGVFMMKACPDWDWHKDMFLIANINVDLQKELLLSAQNVLVHVKTVSLGTKSFVLQYAITSEKNSETIVHATGTTTQIMFDMKTRTTIEIPDWIRTSLSEYDSL